MGTWWLTMSAVRVHQTPSAQMGSLPPAHTAQFQPLRLPVLLPVRVPLDFMPSMEHAWRALQVAFVQVVQSLPASLRPLVRPGHFAWQEALRRRSVQMVCISF